MADLCLYGDLQSPVDLEKFLIKLAFTMKRPSLVFSLKVVEDENVETIMTNGVEIHYNKNFINTITNKQKLSFIIFHEIAHILFHCGKNSDRSKNKNQQIYNIACEYIANSFAYELCNNIEDSRFLNNIYFSRKYDLRNWTTEEVYYDLLNQQKEFTLQLIDNHDHFKDADPIELEINKKNIQNSIEQCKGNSLEYKELDINYKYVNYKFALRNLLTCQYDYKWKKLNRRYLHNKIYCPSIIPTTLEFAIAIDTSGSMRYELEKCISYVHSIISGMNDYIIHLIECSTDVTNYVKLVNTNIPNPYKFRGLGGTNFVPVFEEITKRKLDNKISFLLFFTDTYGTFPNKKPKYPVYWFVTTIEHRSIPFGKKIPIF